MRSSRAGELGARGRSASNSLPLEFIRSVSCRFLAEQNANGILARAKRRRFRAVPKLGFHFGGITVFPQNNNLVQNGSIMARIAFRKGEYTQEFGLRFDNASIASTLGELPNALGFAQRR